MKPRTRRGLRLGGLALLLLIAAGVALWQIFGSDPAADAIPVTVEAARTTTLQTRVVGSCTFRPRRSITVVSDTGGLVLGIPAGVGELVSTGQELVEFERRDLQVALREAELAHRSAELDVRRNLANLHAGLRTTRAGDERARAALERSRQLWRAGSITRDELEQAEHAAHDAAGELRSAREQINLAAGRPPDAAPDADPGADDALVAASPEVIRARLSAHQATLDLASATVVAPLAGTVTALGVSLGNHVGAGTAVATVATLDDILAEVRIDEVDIGKIQLGQPVVLTTDSVRDAELQGRIVLIPPSMADHVVTIQVDVDEGGLPAGAHLRAGASCRARIEAELKRDVTAVPFAALQERPGGSIVFVAVPAGEDATLHRLELRTVELGLSSVNEVELTAGVEPGELVVVGNLSLLRDRLTVTLEPDAPDDGAPPGAPAEEAAP